MRKSRLAITLTLAATTFLSSAGTVRAEPTDVLAALEQMS